MKESLFDIFQKHRDCYDYRKDPTIEEQQTAPEARQLMAERFRERKQAASEYASSLIPLGNDWIEAVKHDVKALTQRLPPSLHFNKVERDAYRDGVVDFLIDVAEALREYGKGQFLNDDYFDPVTLYRFGIMTDWEEPQTGLTKDEATKICKDFKQRYSKVYCFPDLFSMFPSTYTVMGYKAKASTPARAQNKATSGFNSMGLGSNATTNQQTQPAAKERCLKDFWKDGKPKEVLDEAINKGLVEKNDDGYLWLKGDPNKGWQVGLYGYFVMRVCERMKWMNNNRIQWKMFKPIIRNHDEILPMAKQTVNSYKKNEGIPTKYYLVDELIEKVFGK